MRYQSGHAEVLAEGFGQSAGFSIMASGKAFKGLIDGIYSRKIEAGIRELATNAFDSHKAAGSIAPFEVHLPTALKPTFYIRDFGIGMSHSFMMNRYTVMFDSTKDGVRDEDQTIITSDEQVGMLGLGRMAFFAYSDSCTVTIWQNGEARFYSVFMGPDGVPQVAHAGSQPSDEPTGVKVEFPVKNKDFAEFERAAIRVFKGFPITPTGLLVTAATALAVEPLQVGAFWKAFPGDHLPKGGYWARQGCVLYPIELAQIDDRSVEKEEQYWDYSGGDGAVRRTRMVPVLSEKFERYNNSNMTTIIDFPIGSLEFDLSRERLAYNDRSVLALRKRWEEFVADLDALFSEKFEAAGSGWNRMALAETAEFTQFGPLFVTSSFNYAAHEVITRLLKEIPAKRNVDAGEAIRSIVHNRGQTDAFAMYNRAAFENANKQGDLQQSVFVYVDEESPRAINKRTLHYLQTHDLKWAFILNARRLKPGLIKALGYPNVIRSSEIPAAPRVARASTGGQRGGVTSPFERIKLIDEKGSTYDGATDEEQYDGHLFAFLNCGTIHNPDPEKYPHHHVSDVMAIHAALRYFKGQSISLINIKSNEFKKINERWADYPLFYGCFDDSILDDIGPKDLRDLVNLINYDRFEGTKYAIAVDRWTAHFPNSDDPLAAMRRFTWRKQRMAPKRRAFLSQFIDSGKLKPLVDQIIDRGSAAGLEVLPPMCGGKGWNEKAFYPYPLLPKKWEQLVKHINNAPPNLRGETGKLIYTAIKEKIGC